MYGELVVDEELAVWRKTSISFAVWLWFGSDSPPCSGFGFDFWVWLWVYLWVDLWVWLWFDLCVWLWDSFVDLICVANNGWV